VKTDQAANAAIEAIVRWDPQGATEAELRTMEEHLDRLGMQVAQAQQAYEKERKEAEVIQSLSHQRMMAAERLQAQASSEADPTRKAELEKSLATLVGMLEEMAPDVDREKAEAADAEEFLTALRQTYDQAGQKLKGARAELQKAQRDMSRAQQQREMAENRAEAARQTAGLSGATSSLSVALKAMQDAAAKDLAQAQAQNAKAKLLAPSQPEKEDRNIAAAMAAAGGQGSSPTSLGDRLAALRMRTGTPATITGPR
jgi:chromosome segregation ATPase